MPSPMSTDTRNNTTATAARADDVVAPPPSKRQRVAVQDRQRAVRACVGCRRIKEKCNGQLPCQRCARLGRTCQFAAVEATSTGRTATAAVAAATVAMTDTGSAQRAATADERVQCLEKLVSHLLGPVPMDLESLQRMSQRINPREAGPQRTTEGATSAWVGSVAQDAPAAPAATAADSETDDLDGVALQDESFTVKMLSQSTAHYSGEFSHWNFSQKVSQRVVECMYTTTTTVGTHEPGFRIEDKAGGAERGTGARGRAGGAAGGAAAGAAAGPAGGGSGYASVSEATAGHKQILEYWRATHLQSPRTLVLSVLGCLPPRPVARFLARTYFAFAQTNCFFVDEAWLRTRLARLYDVHRDDLSTADAGWICSVLMVLAIGTQYAYMRGGVPAGADAAQDDGFDPASPEMAPAEDDIGRIFYQTAAKLIPDVIALASLESVQACLLLAHYALPLDTQGLAYTYLGLAIKLAVQNGMHRKAAGAELDLDPWAVEMRNRLWWTAYTLDRRVSVLHGRPMSISPTEMDTDRPRDVPAFRTMSGGGGTPGSALQFENLSALLDLTMHLDDMAKAITLLRHCPKAQQPAFFDRTMDAWQKMQTWWQQLPQNRQTTPLCSSSGSRSPHFRANVHLQLSFNVAQIFAGRPFIFRDKSEGLPPGGGETGAATAATERPSEGPAGRPADGPSPVSGSGRPSRRALLVDAAVDAAHETIRLCALLHETTGLAAASYTEFSACRAALLLLLAQSLLHPDDRPTRDAIARGVRLLRTMAAAGGHNVSTRSETSVVEAIQAAVARLHARQRQQQQQQKKRRRRGGGEGPSGEEDDDSDNDGSDDNNDEDEDEDGAVVARSGYERYREWTTHWRKSSSTGEGGSAAVRDGGGSGGGGERGARGGQHHDGGRGRGEGQADHHPISQHSHSSIGRSHGHGHGHGHGHHGHHGHIIVGNPGPGRFLPQPPPQTPVNMAAATVLPPGRSSLFSDALVGPLDTGGFAAGGGGGSSGAWPAAPTMSTAPAPATAQQTADVALDWAALSQAGFDANFAMLDSASFFPASVDGRLGWPLE